MKHFIISVVAVVAVVATLIGIYFTCVVIQNARIDNTQNTELEIAEVVNTVSGNCHKEYTILIVYEENGDKYTLPKIYTRYVREYHEGDTLPVTIKNYKDGSYDIEVDRSKLD